MPVEGTDVVEYGTPASCVFVTATSPETTPAISAPLVPIRTGPAGNSALPSVVGGLVTVPVIAVPTSVGYGASFQGLAALLGMLNSCASNVTVVNIDNGFGAGYSASLMNRL